MKEAKIKVPVLLIFFCRPGCFKKVFEQVRIARPSKLFLYQDGPRLNKPNDIENVNQCRKIAEGIDWACEVHKFYQERNVGCDPSEYIAIKWMFNHVDCGIILEDDDVPSQSFFPFCEQLLEMYKNNAHINKIMGMNHKGIYKRTKYDYFFTNVCSISGWATWKRCTDLWQERLDFLDDKESLRKVYDSYSNKRIYEIFIQTCKWHRNTGKAYYESINEAAQRLNGQFNIAPSKNLISNIGLTADATHTGATNPKMMPKAMRQVFGAKTYDLAFPLKHPKEIKLDYVFEKYVHDIIYPSRIKAILRQIETLMLMLFASGTEGRARIKDIYSKK